MQRDASALNQLTTQRAKRSLLREAARPDVPRDRAFETMILSIPAGKVSTYGAVAAAAGYPRYHRAVARLLRTMPVDHRVVGAGGAIKLKGDAAREQKARLQLEAVKFSGDRVPMETYEHQIKPWETWR